MKTYAGILLVTVMTLALFACYQKSEVQGKQDLTEAFRTSVVVNDICVEDLRFYKSNLMTYYACEAGWTRDLCKPEKI